MKHAIAIALLLSVGSAQAAPVAHGKASWYGQECADKLMANGKPFNPRAYTAASYDYPLGTRLDVSYGHKHVQVVVTDRGPAHRLGRLLDLSESAATALGYHQAGVTTVDVKVLIP
jgi:rare lipoprotein A